MAQDNYAPIGKKLAQIVSTLTTAAILQGADNALTACHMAMSAMAGPLMIGGGLISKGFYEAEQAANPGFSAKPDNMLFVALLIARSISPHGDGAAVELDAVTISLAVEDFKKLCPLVDITTVVRGDLLRLAERDMETANCTTAGILAKRLN